MLSKKKEDAGGFHRKGDLLKINVDATILKVERIEAVAAVCRDGYGYFIAASAATYFDFDDPETPETLAYTEALVLAENCNTNVQVASDCQNVVKNIHEMPRYSYMMIRRGLSPLFQ